MRRAKVFMARWVLSYERMREGNDQVFASGIWPKPLALLPPNELTIQFTFKMMIWDVDVPPEFNRDTVVIVLEFDTHAFNADVGASGHTRLSVLLGTLALRIAGQNARPAVTDLRSRDV